jgi:hypothetical protein
MEWVQAQQPLQTAFKIRNQLRDAACIGLRPNRNAAAPLLSFLFAVFVFFL